MHFMNKALIASNLSNLEPVGSVSPKVTTGEEFKVIRYELSQNLNILCPAQAYPTPVFR